ncbi:MAG: hypothetical protein IKN07_08310, partial [Lachnospiraceae bacterium]|nr:hypothetical protein [Lachnospiraceae bacterium]
YGIAVVFLLPLCLLKNASKMRYASTFGILSLFFLIIIVVAECPFYIKKNIIDENQEVNYFDFISGLRGNMKLLQSIVTVFYAFSCHVGAFPVLQTLHNPTQKRTKKVLFRAISLDTICYLIIGATGYLTQPLHCPDLIIERNKLFESDWLMTIGEICFILTLLAKIRLSIIMSDFLSEDFVEDDSKLAQVIKYLQFKKQKVVLLHIMAEEELEIDLSGTYYLIDSENTDSKLRVTMDAEAVNSYMEKLEEFTGSLKRCAKKLNASYHLCSTKDRFDKIVFEELRDIYEF